MSTHEPHFTVDEFERESRHIESNVWESLCIEPGAKVLFCGFGPQGEHVSRAMDEGANVYVIEHRDDAIARFGNLGAKLIRGSTSVIPAKENTFDLAVSFHYLHEIDPFFHAQVLSELARVAARVAIVEPAPPGDALGKRIALLYSQAKRELGQFEYYQPIDYWKKLLHSVKADVSQHVFAFGRVPPREYLKDTIELLLHTIEVEDAPKSYIEELRQIARRSDTQLLPPPRFVLIGAAIGELPLQSFSAREPAPEPALAAPAARTPAVAKSLPRPAPIAPAPEKVVSEEGGYEFPPVDTPAAAQVPPPTPAPKPGPAPKPSTEPPPGFTPGLPFGAPSPPEPPGAKQPPQTPFGAPFATPPSEAYGAPPVGIPPSSTWQWEPPESGDETETPFRP